MENEVHLWAQTLLNITTFIVIIMGWLHMISATKESRMARHTVLVNAVANSLKLDALATTTERIETNTNGITSALVKAADGGIEK